MSRGSRRRLVPVRREAMLPFMLAGALLAGSTALAAGVGTTDTGSLAAEATEVGGVVVDEVGTPVSGATVTFGRATRTTGDDGAFSFRANGPGWLAAKADGHLSRTLMLEPGQPREVDLTRNTAGTVSLRFGGDVMVGRRFYEPGTDRGPLITARSGAAEHQRLLRGIQPLLEDADLSVVNLETPLLTEPYYDPEGPRPKKFHPTKDLAFGTSPAMAQGLSDAGVDAVSLGNNHTLDGLGPGLATTIRALDDAGVVHFGAGMDEDEAWAPATIEVRGQRVSFIGCTTVAGETHAIPYVAGPDRPGAALCSTDRLVQAIEEARANTDTVVVMLHGDTEYRRAQTPIMRQLATTAHRAGARIVIGSHPHVIGGMSVDQGSIFAETTGNLLFDQDLWSTFPSYLMRVDVRRGAPVQVTTDPLVMDDYRPRPAVGPFADAVARIAAGTVRGAARFGGPGATLTLGKSSPQKSTSTLPAGTLAELNNGWWVDPSHAREARLGTDLLYGTGTFEPLSTGGAPGRLWTFGKYSRVTDEARCDLDGHEGRELGHGVLLARGPLSTLDVVADQSHRMAVSTRKPVSLLADVRRATAGSTLEIKWYARAEGASLGTSALALPEGSHGADDCESVRLDTTVPAGARYAQVFVRLESPSGGQLVRRAAIDNVRFVLWDDKPTGGRQYDIIEAPKAGPVTFVRDERIGSDQPFVPVSSGSPGQDD